MFEPGQHVLVAVSGGPDSLALLHALVRLQRLLRIQVTCFHFDHRLREGSEADAAYVRGQARRLGVSFVLREAASKPSRGESVEAWARAARYEALGAVVEEFGGGVAAVGHTADDQAETILLALIRGAGADALGGMSPVSRPVVRPLLATTRQETEAFCRALRLRPRRDPMNEDPRFMRVALRRAIPDLERALGRGIRESLARSAALLRQDADFLDELAASAEGAVVRRDGDDILLVADRLARLAPALSSRIVRRVLFSLRLTPEATHVQAVLSLASGRPGKRRQLPGGLLVRRDKGYVRLSPPSPERSRARRRPSADPREG